VDGLGAHAGALVGQFTHHDDGLALAAEQTADFLGFQRAGDDFLRSDEGLLVRQFVDVDRLAVDIDQRNAGIGGDLRHGDGRVGVDRVDDDRIDAGGDEVLNLALLLGDVVLRVFDLQRHPVQRLGIILHAVAKHGQEVVVEQCHRHADGFRMGGRAQQNGHGGAQNELSHDFSSSNGARLTFSCRRSAFEPTCTCSALPTRRIKRNE